MSDSQPSLSSKGWTDLKKAPVEQLCAAMLFSQLIADRQFAKAAEMALDPSLEKDWKSSLKELLDEDPNSPIAIQPDPLSWSPPASHDAATAKGWVYVPLFIEDSEMLEAVTMNLHEVESAEAKGHYDLSPLAKLDGFNFIETVKVPKSIKVEVLEWGRP